MKWIFIYYCVTVADTECMKLNEKISWLTFQSQQECVVVAEILGEIYWNERKFELEFKCAQNKWEPYVPHIRN